MNKSTIVSILILKFMYNVISKLENSKEIGDPNVISFFPLFSHYLLPGEGKGKSYKKIYSTYIHQKNMRVKEINTYMYIFTVYIFCD